MLAHPAGVADAGQRMVVGDEVVGVVALLKRDVLADRAEVVADVQGARRLDSRQDPHDQDHSLGTTRFETHPDLRSPPTTRVMPSYQE